MMRIRAMSSSSSYAGGVNSRWRSCRRMGGKLMSSCSCTAPHPATSHRLGGSHKKSRPICCLFHVHAGKVLFDLAAHSMWRCPYQKCVNTNLAFALPFASKTQLLPCKVLSLSHTSIKYKRAIPRAAVAGGARLDDVHMHHAQQHQLCLWS